MARRGFLYIGITFLIMLAILISANYLFMSKHTSQGISKTEAMEIDLTKNMGVGVKNIIVFDANNSVSDALSDAAYQAIDTFGNAHPSTNALCTRLDPTKTESRTYGTNVTQWVWDYADLTFLSVQNAIMPLELKYSIINVTADMSACSTTGIKILFNSTYNVTANSSDIFMRANFTAIHKKNLRITRTASSSPGWIYDIIVTDESGRTDFSNKVYCPSGFKCMLACDDGTYEGGCSSTRPLRCIGGGYVVDLANCPCLGDTHFDPVTERCV